MAGKFDGVKGVVIGRFSKKKREAPDKPTDFTMEEVFKQYFSKSEFPVIYNFPSGHGAKNISLPLGILAEINTDTQVLDFLNLLLKINVKIFHLFDYYDEYVCSTNQNENILNEIIDSMGAEFPNIVRTQKNTVCRSFTLK